jgi:Carboxypeptidase regulatory-like domain
MRRILTICGAAAWMSIRLLGSSPTWSQSLASQLHGNVTDPSGAAIPNATVHLINSATNSDRTTTTDQRGSYIFSELAPGTYRLLIAVQGFETYEQSDIHLFANAPTTADVKLKIEQVQQSVTVRSHPDNQCLAPQARILSSVGPGLRVIRRGPSGNYYVLTAPGAAAAIYTPDGKRIGQVPTESSIGSSADSSIVNGSDLQVDSSGRVYIADLAANAVRIYSAAGILVGKIHVPAPVSVEPLSDGEVAVASLSSKYLVDVYNEGKGEVYRSFGDISDTDVERCDPTILSCTVVKQDTDPLMNRRWFYGDSAGNVYVNPVNLTAPTIRKYDSDGFLAYESILPLNHPASAADNSNWTMDPRMSGGRATTGGGAVPGTSPGGGGMRGARMQGEGMRLGLQITQGADSARSNPVIDAIGVDPKNSEVWATIGANLVHLDQDGNLEGYYCLSTSDQAPIKVSTILVEPNRILLGIDPFGIFQYPRPDKPSPDAAASH